MTNFTYNRDIPESTNNPSVDQPDMKINTNSIDELINVDHNSFGVDDGGYHKVIHEVTQGADPATIAGVNQIYSKFYTPDTTGGVPDTQLFSKTGLGGVSQLTGNLGSADGWQWIGGVLVQWGVVSFAPGSDHETSTVTFKDRVPGAIRFPNNIFIVNGTLLVASQSETVASNTLAIRSFSATQFRWVYNSSSSTGSTRYPGFYWIAIGN